MDPESAWAIARTNWVTQLLVHFEKINDNQIADEAFLKDLPKLSINQIAFWDEMHKEQIVGYMGKKSYLFNCDPNGKYVPHGKIMTDAGSRLHIK